MNNQDTEDFIKATPFTSEEVARAKLSIAEHGHLVVSVPHEIAFVIKHLLDEGYLRATLAFTLTDENHGHLLPEMVDGDESEDDV